MTLDTIRTVAVLGAGTMGNGIAHVFARCGYDVILRDVEESFLVRAKDTIAKNLDREVKKGKIVEGDKSKILGRINTTTDLSEIARADFAVEAVPERLDLKLSVLREADKLLPRGNPRLEHVFDFSDHSRRGHRAARPLHRHALHESRPGDDSC